MQEENLKLKLNFLRNYPTDCPIFSFKTKICHIDINREYICLSSLNNYNSKTSISYILCQFFMMLTSPNENSPFSSYIDLYNYHHEEYLRKAIVMKRV